MSKPTTRFADSTNPWTKQKMTKTNKSMAITDPSLISICHDPLPVSRSAPDGKYTELFSKLQYGQCLRVPPGSAPRIATALKHYLRKNRSNATVRSVLRYDGDSEGFGRVWLIEPEKKLKAA